MGYMNRENKKESAMALYVDKSLNYKVLLMMYRYWNLWKVELLEHLDPRIQLEDTLEGMFAKIN